MWRSFKRQSLIHSFKPFKSNDSVVHKTALAAANRRLADQLQFATSSCLLYCSASVEISTIDVCQIFHRQANGSRHTIRSAVGNEIHSSLLS